MPQKARSPAQCQDSGVSMFSTRMRPSAAVCCSSWRACCSCCRKPVQPLLKVWMSGRWRCVVRCFRLCARWRTAAGSVCEWHSRIAWKSVNRPRFCESSAFSSAVTRSSGWMPVWSILREETPVDRSTAAALGKPALFSPDNSQMRWLSSISNRSVRLLRLMVSARQAVGSVAWWFTLSFQGQDADRSGVRAGRLKCG